MTKAHNLQEGRRGLGTPAADGRNGRTGASLHVTSQLLTLELARACEASVRFQLPHYHSVLSISSRLLLIRVCTSYLSILWDF